MRNVLWVLLASMLLAGCATVVNNAASAFGENLSSAILNQDDPAIVKAGMPSYILLLDSFLQDDRDNAAILDAAANLYASYGAVFADEPQRAQRLTRRARDYANEAACLVVSDACQWRDLTFDEFEASLLAVESDDAEMLYTWGLASLAYIRAHSSDYGALAQIPQATAAMQRYITLAGDDANAAAHSYLGILKTFRGELGGQMDEGKAEFERAIYLSRDRDLSAKVEYLKGYARARYDRELNDQLCDEILTASPYADGYTLTNVLAQEEATTLCAEADDYF
ncbi:MAG: TRAP transporter TatT component family protein [Pseudomonadota bacterium]